MGTLLPEKQSTKKTRAIKELVQGQEFASQLQLLLHKPFQEHGSLSEDLVLKILRSFTQTLSVLTSCDSDEVSQDQQATSCDDSPSFDDRRSEDSGESRKGPPSKRKRGCYKRKKNSQTWVVASPTFEDGHAWRKYGQKEILNAKYPRSYFRCTHKYDQGCRATKQVQRLEHDPQMYQTTYIGNHTCSDTLKAPKMITDSDTWATYKVVASSDSNMHPFTTPTLQQVSKAETPSDDLANHVSSMDSILWKDLIPLEPAAPVVSTIHLCGEATNINSHALEPVGFDGNDFRFDESEFF